MNIAFSEAHGFHLGKLTTYPIIPIAMIGKGSKRVDTYALVDSGAEDCIFHAKWLRRLGFNLKAGRYETRGSVESGASIDCYVHRIWLIIGNGRRRIRVDVAFSEEIGEAFSDQLIGRDVVFTRYRFGFQQHRQMTYLGREP